jgi:ribosomal subunit interface protein
MTIQFYLDNVTLPAVAQAAIERKINRLCKLDRALAMARVDVSRDRHHRHGQVYRFELNLTPATGAALRGVATAESIGVAGEDAIEKIERQLLRRKSKVQARRRT